MVGRTKEIQELNQLYSSGRAELAAVYGRRRIGKTYLVDETFKGRITFRHAGLSPVEGGKDMLKRQLEHFFYSLKLHGAKAAKKPTSWIEAFYMLETFLQETDDGSRQLVFLDELPWMDSPRSGFLTAFEGFWNNWGCHRSNLMVVVCGSANSWIQDELINNHGGLYNRVTHEIKLSPFTLKECEEFFAEKRIRISRYDIVQSQMIFGGIPYYLGYFQDGLSLAQNVDALFFSGQAKLRDEFNRLFASVFSNPEVMQNIVKLLYTKNCGYTRSEIAEKTGYKDGGSLSKNLNALIASDFILKYVPFGKGQKEHYKLVDPFCLFYLHFVENRKNRDEHFWQNHILDAQVVIWRGFAFENVCFNHVEEIKRALGISGVSTQQSAWSKTGDEKEGTQIDLLIIRKDNIVNMCELKYYSDDFQVDKAYYRVLLNREEILIKEIPKSMTIHNTLITTFGVKQNEYSGIFSKVITMDDLFA